MEAVPAFRVKPVDAVAAGDVFSGAFAVARTEGQTIKEAVRFACAAAAISVTRKGAQTSIPKRDEIEAFLARRARN
jgi:ribokinase